VADPFQHSNEHASSEKRWGISRLGM